MSGTGKSTLLKSFIKQNIDEDEGFTLLDPHGDLALEIIKLIPEDRVDRLVYIDPTTVKVFGRTVRINFLEYRDDWEKERVGEAFISALQKLFADFWGPRLEHILRNCVYTLLEQPQGTTNLLDLYYLLTDENRRGELLAKVRDPLVLKFWEEEWGRLPKEAIVSVINKVSKLVGSKILRPIFSAKKSTIDFRKLMDKRAFIVINLSKGRLTEEVSHFLGTLIVGKIFSAAMSRIDIAPHRRIPHYLYIDEAHNYSVPAIVDILAEARKYKLYLTLATQYPEQYSRDVLNAILGNCRMFITFRVGPKSAKLLKKLYEPIFSEADLVNLPRYWFAVKTEVKGKLVRPFTLQTIYIPVEIKGSRFEDDPEIYRRIKRSLELYGAPVEPEEIGLEIPGEEEVPPIPIKEPPLRPIEAYALYVLYHEAPEGLPKSILADRLSSFFGVSSSKALSVIRGIEEIGFIEVIEAPSKGRGRKPKICKLAEKGRELVEVVFTGERAGGEEHQQLVFNVVEQLRLELGAWTWIDTGALGTAEQPDVIAIPLENVDKWNLTKALFIEVEVNPRKHPDKIMKYIERAKKINVALIFITKDAKDAEYVQKLRATSATIDSAIRIIREFLR